MEAVGHKLDWVTNRFIDDMKEVRYKGEYLRIHENGPDDFVGFIGDLDMKIEDDSFEAVEKKMIDFCDLA